MLKQKREMGRKEQYINSTMPPNQDQIFLWLQTLSDASCGNDVELTYFHSEHICDVSLKKMFSVISTNVMRMLRFENVSSSCIEEHIEESLLVFVLIYINRLVKLKGLDYFQGITGHRILIAAFLLALKYNVDRIPSNASYARCCGLELAEINRLENKLLSLLEYRLHVTCRQFERMCNHIIVQVELGCDDVCDE